MSRVCLSKTETLKHLPSLNLLQCPRLPQSHGCLAQQKPRIEVKATCISHLKQSSHLGSKQNLWEGRSEAWVAPVYDCYICLPHCLPLPSCSNPAPAHPSESTSHPLHICLSHCVTTASSLTPASLSIQQTKAQALVLYHLHSSTLH